MKVYVSESDDIEKNLLNDFDIVPYEEAEDILILPGGLGCLYDLFRSIHDKKNIYLYNKDFFFTSIISSLYELFEKKIEDRVPEEYMNIESDFSEILRLLEEKKNGKINDGKTSKLL
jgi:hypothetical protein